MNHKLIKKILKIVSMVAFIGIIIYQLYNIIVNGGSKEDKLEPCDDECTLECVENEEYPAVPGTVSSTSNFND